jgi:hypothetical protein
MCPPGEDTPSLTGRFDTKSLLAVRVVAFVCATLVTALILNMGLFIYAAVTDQSRYAVATDCLDKSADCGALMEFLYDDTWPLVPLLLLIPSAPIGWFVARRIH